VLFVDRREVALTGVLWPLVRGNGPVAGVAGVSR